ncbi:thioredoxin [Clostridium magnum]|uniref:Thioredoxin n=1 Tax=Clostridium magnum DSM 2767 TaxID=1121326 RepID=A0A162TYT2_9CLOT|nr:thioredoxin [Clostridium magnum]KZL93227.1 thioredoxin [Clostridium magnum DSM 2767]SHI19414.1 thioredoxin [Clostridium magnum DSM 2767]
MISEIKDTNFAEIIKSSSEPVVVDFWASWCGPCKMLAPVIDEISGEIGDKAKFFKLNVDENPVTSTQYKIASIPTVMVLKNGEVVDTLVGFRPKDAIKSVIEKHI